MNCHHWGEAEAAEGALLLLPSFFPFLLSLFFFLFFFSPFFSFQNMIKGKSIEKDRQAVLEVKTICLPVCRSRRPLASHGMGMVMVRHQMVC